MPDPITSVQNVRALSRFVTVRATWDNPALWSCVSHERTGGSPAGGSSRVVAVLRFGYGNHVLEVGE
jgi:hypothetical protein